MNDTVNDDCADLAEARQGHEAAFRRIYDRHAAVVLSLCRRNAGGSAADAEAEDALQETFIRAFRKLDEVHDCRGFRSWVYRIARLVCSERRRSERRRRHHEGAAMQRMIDEATTTVAPASAQATVQRERLDRLTHALDRLDDDERLAIHLYYLDSDPVAAAQSALGLGRSAFYKLLARAREALAAQLREAVQS